MAASHDDTTEVFCRKCLGFWVTSRTGPSTTPRSTDDTTTVRGGSRGGQYPVDESSANSNGNIAAMIVVLVGALVVLTAIMVIVVLLRRKRIRNNRLLLNGNNNNNTVVAKEANGDEAQSEGEKWSAGAVELVVMAGETTPTFLAHPVPSPVVVQCPPLMIQSIPKDGPLNV